MSWKLHYVCEGASEVSRHSSKDEALQTAFTIECIDQGRARGEAIQILGPLFSGIVIGRPEIQASYARMLGSMNSTDVLDSVEPARDERAAGPCQHLAKLLFMPLARAVVATLHAFASRA
jgi:hypothetical protein